MKRLTGTLLVALAGTAVAAFLYAADQASAPAFESITYKDSGGFAGGGTGKSLRLAADGKGEASTRFGQPVTIQLSAADLASLNAAVAAVDWPNLKAAYAKPNAADLVVRDLTIVINGEKHEVHADAMAAIPATLRRLFDSLDEIYGRATHRER
jgi:hypothetical protein